uniref:Uncharacterized protein n=1 Tax=Plectus sambesii TaxID=2011161 RepID=A0A914V468_9BILA
MLYACLGVCVCVSVGLVGLALSIIDIDRYNFGLYLTLLAVVGTTIAIAFWIVKPEMCNSPQWFDRATTVLSIQISTTFGKRQKRRKRSAKSNRSASSMRTTSVRRPSTKRRRKAVEDGEEVQKRSNSAQPPHALSVAQVAPIVRRSSTTGRIQITPQDEANNAIAKNSVHTEMSPLLNSNLSKKRSSTWYSLYRKNGDDSAFHDSPASSVSHGPCSCLLPMELHEQASQTEITATASQKLMLISGCDEEDSARLISSCPEHQLIAHLPRSASDNPAIPHSLLFSSYPPIDSDAYPGSSFRDHQSVARNAREALTGCPPGSDDLRP